MKLLRKGRRWSDAVVVRIRVRRNCGESKEGIAKKAMANEGASDSEATRKGPGSHADG